MTQDDPIPTQRGRQHPKATDPPMSYPFIHPTGGFASHQPADADYAVQVCREQDRLVHVRRWVNGDPRMTSANSGTP